MKNTYKRSYKKTYKKMRSRHRGREQRKLPPFAIAAIVCAAALVVVFLAVNLWGYKNEGSVAPVTDTDTFAADADEPFIEMETAKGALFNKLTATGSGEFSNSEAAGSLTPLADDRQQTIRISVSKDKIKKISYQVRNLNGELIESTEVGNITEDGGETKAVLPIKNLLSAKREYKLQIKLETTDYPVLVYNTKVELLGDVWIEEKLAYVNKFTNNLYNTKDGTSFVTKALLPRSDSVDNNFALAGYYSLTTHVMWSRFSPSYSGGAVPTIVRVDSDSTKVTQSYPITVTDNGVSRRVVVNEAIAVRMNADDTVEIVNYDRKAYETMTAENLSVTSLGMRIGFSADDDISLASDANGKYAAFVNGGNLWSVCSGTGTADNGADKSSVTRVFSFGGNDGTRDDASSDIEVSNDGTIKSVSSNFDIKIISVGNNGDISFAVYGVFRSGTHIGQSGIGIYKYTKSSASLIEISFLQINSSLSELADIIDRSYLNTSGAYFLVNNSKLVKVDTGKLEAETVAENVSSYYLPANRSYIAYVSTVAYTEGKKDNALASEIKLYDFENEKDTVITAADGEVIKLIGSIGGDVIYGVAEKTDILVKDGKNNVYFNKIVFVDKDGNIIKEYKEDGTYFGDMKINDAAAEFTKYTKNADNFTKNGTNKIIGVIDNATSTVSATWVSKGSDGKFLWLVFSSGSMENDGTAVNIVSDYKYPDNDVIKMP